MDMAEKDTNDQWVNKRQSLTRGTASQRSVSTLVFFMPLLILYFKNSEKIVSPLLTTGMTVRSFRLLFLSNLT
jgi:hypothetical protein